jgi:large subunit ribosomal protein L24e
MPNCSFCKNSISDGKDRIYAKKDGTVFHFCSSKCKRNALNLKREGRRQNWTTASREFKESLKKKSDKAKKK